MVLLRVIKFCLYFYIVLFIKDPSLILKDSTFFLFVFEGGVLESLRVSCLGTREMTVGKVRAVQT